MRNRCESLVAVLLIALMWGCDEDGGDGDADADVDADSDADADSDVDADSDADSDADGDADGDTDEDADADAEADAEGPIGFCAPTSVAEINTDALDSGPELSADGLTIYFMSQREGGLGNRDLYSATRAAIDEPFGEPVNITELNTESDDRSPAISADQLTIYFASNRPGGSGDEDILFATRADTESAFGPPEFATEVNTASYDGSPSLSGDGLTLYFSSDRSGNMDIWMATREAVTLPFGDAEAVAELNTAETEWSPSLTSDGLTIYFAARGGTWADIFSATRTDPAGPFGAPEAITEIGTEPDDESPCISADGDTLFFARQTILRDRDIYVTTRTCRL